MPKQQSAELKGNLFVLLSVKFPDDHFLDSEAKYKVTNTHTVVFYLTETLKERSNLLMKDKIAEYH